MIEPMSRMTRWCLCLAALLCIGTALARHHPGRGQEAASAQFDYYLLTLSWAPTYCLTHGDDRSQCSGKGYGFVLHGLWPQFESGGYPEHCPTPSRLSPQAEAVGRTAFPSLDLMRHEWQAHGTCSGLDAITYFRTADRALGRVRIPAPFEAPAATATMTPAQIAALFHAANPAIPEGGMTVACGRRGLSEVRLCLSRDLTFRSCGRGVRNSCPVSPVDVPAAR
jgi:ribonuclease T2